MMDSSLEQIRIYLPTQLIRQIKEAELSGSLSQRIEEIISHYFAVGAERDHINTNTG
jgi:type II secretory pathway component PulF